jgi:hypothetical protein
VFLPLSEDAARIRLQSIASLDRLAVPARIGGSWRGARAHQEETPTPVEAEHIASDMVMNDGGLKRGDIVSTDRGFYLYRGLGPDGLHQ